MNVRTDSERAKPMSSQPSQKDVARSAVASAVQNVAETIDPSQTKDDDESKKEPTLKDKLDQAAYTTTGNAAAQKKDETFVEKAASYIPGLSSILGNGTGEKETSATAEEKQENPTPGPAVKRPDHDLHVEEFIKEQYKSRSGADMPNVGEKSRGAQGEE